MRPGAPAKPTLTHHSAVPTRHDRCASTTHATGHKLHIQDAATTPRPNRFQPPGPSHTALQRHHRAPNRNLRSPLLCRRPALESHPGESACRCSGWRWQTRGAHQRGRRRSRMSPLAPRSHLSAAHESRATDVAIREDIARSRLFGRFHVRRRRQQQAHRSTAAAGSSISGSARKLAKLESAHRPRGRLPAPR